MGGQRPRSGRLPGCRGGGGGKPAPMSSRAVTAASFLAPGKLCLGCHGTRQGRLMSLGSTWRAQGRASRAGPPRPLLPR